MPRSPPQAPRPITTRGSARATGTTILSPPPHHPCPLTANPDSYSTGTQATLSVEGTVGRPRQRLRRAPTIVANTEPTHGSLDLEADGGFTYTPEAGFSGTDSFSYTIADAVHVYKTDLPPIGSFEGDAAGGRLLRLLGRPGPRPPERILRPRGPRPEREAPAASRSSRSPATTRRSPASSSTTGEAELVERIPLQDRTGHPFSGLVNSQAPTGETIENLKGDVARPRPRRLRPRGPGRDARRQLLGLRRVRPVHHPLHREGPRNPAVSRRYDGTLPARAEEPGAEPRHGGPDDHPRRQDAGRDDAVGAAAGRPAAKARTRKNWRRPGSSPTASTPTRCTSTCSCSTNRPHATTANSEITALSNNTFLIDERDGNFPSADRLQETLEGDLEGATDVGPQRQSHRRDLQRRGRRPADRRQDDRDQRVSARNGGSEGRRSKPTRSSRSLGSLYLDIDALLTQLNPADAFFDHDKVEGVSALEGGKRLMISNDNDFGISGAEAAPAGSPNKWQVDRRRSCPRTGKQDDGEYLGSRTCRRCRRRRAPRR